MWQRDRDSNPGYPCGYNGFRIRPVRPLRHLSTSSDSCPVTYFYQTDYLSATALSATKRHKSANCIIHTLRHEV